MSCDLIIELHTVSASLLPSAQDVGLVGIENTGSLASFAVMHFGVLLCLDKCPDSFPRELEFACNHSLTEPLLTESTHVFIAGRALVSSDLLLEFVVRASQQAVDRGMGEWFGRISPVLLLLATLPTRGCSCL